MCADKLTPISSNLASSDRSAFSPTPDQGIDLSAESFHSLPKERPLVLPPNISSLNGQVQKFDPVRKEVYSLPLAEVMSDRLRSFFEKPSLDSIKPLTFKQVGALLNGTAGNLPLSQLVIIPEVCPSRIPSFRTDPQGVLAIVDKLTTLHSAVVLFSSPDLAPEYHLSFLDYVLSWPDRVDLRRNMLIDRINSNKKPTPTGEWFAFRKVEYEKVIFKDSSCREWNAHILLSRPCYQEDKIIDKPAKELARYSDILKVVGLNEKHPFKVLNNSSEILYFLNGKTSFDGQYFDIIDLTVLNGNSKRNLFKSQDGFNKLLSVLSERGAIQIKFDDLKESDVKEKAQECFRKVISEQSRESDERLKAAQSRTLSAWDSQPYVWLRHFEHQVLSREGTKEVQLFLSKESKISTLPELLIDASVEFKTELVRRYKNGREFQKLSENPRRATAKEVMNFVLDELLMVYAGQAESLTPISKLGEMFSIDKAAIGYYQDLLLREDVRILITQERKRSARSTRDSIVTELEKEIESFKRGDINKLNSNQVLKEKYNLHGGQLEKYIKDGLSSWTARYRSASLELMPSEESNIRNQLHRKMISHVREELRQYRETAKPVSTLGELRKRFNRSESKINRAIHIYLTAEEQVDRMRSTLSDSHRKPKLNATKRLEVAIESVRDELRHLKDGKIERITLPSIRANQFGIDEKRLNEGILKELTPEELGEYNKAAEIHRREIKSRLMKQNRKNPDVKPQEEHQ